MTSPIDLFDIQDNDGVFVVTFREPSLASRTDLDTFFNRMKRRIDASEQPQLVMDFRHVTNLSSVFVGQLLALNRAILHKEGKLELVQVNESVYQVFSLTRVHEYLKVRKAEEQYDLPEAPRAVTMSTHQGAWWVFCVTVCLSAMVGVMILVRLASSSDTESDMLPESSQVTWASSYFLAAIPGALAVFLTQGKLRFTHMYVQWALAAIVLGLTVWSTTVLLGEAV